MSLTIKLISTNIVFLATSLFCYAQKLESNNYAYTIGTYFHTSAKYNNPFVVYNGKIFEFIIKNKVFNESTVSIDDGTESEIKTTYVYDTTSVQIIDLKTNRFILVDGFVDSCKVINYGKYDTSKIGHKHGISKINCIENLGENIKRDTIINGTKYYFTSETQKDEQGNDSTVFYLLFLKKTNFLSIFYPAGLNHNELHYCGMSFKHLASNENLLYLVENIRPISQNEENICAKMIKKIENTMPQVFLAAKE
ncbi:MAG: hypothetical protein MUE72_01725 [Chitinophagaceae bacterium]|jgi:hypothetical protein|nr:hypothetical protein [Chitinophagaceae bacterium]